MEIITKIGTLLGYVSTGVALFILIKTQVLNKTDKHIKEVVDTEGSEKVHHEHDERLDKIEERFRQFLEADAAFKAKMDRHIESQTNVDKKLMANIIENLYYQNRDKRCLDMNEFRRLTDVYAIYHGDQIHGNSYISELYEEMILWDRV